MLTRFTFRWSSLLQALRAFPGLFITATMAGVGNVFVSGWLVDFSAWAWLQFAGITLAFPMLLVQCFIWVWRHSSDSPEKSKRNT